MPDRPDLKRQHSVLEMRNLISIGLILFFSKTAWAESAIFDYDDFGPQVLAYEIIGYQWYQWNDVGSPDPRKIDDIKVVIYWNEPLASIKEKYAVNKKKNKDFRYLTYETAMKYLDSTIAKYQDASHLTETRKKLVKLKKQRGTEPIALLLSQRFNSITLSLGMSQNKFAAAFGISVNTLRHWERGENSTGSGFSSIERGR